MAPEGREAGAVVLTEGCKGNATGEKSVIDVLAVGDGVQTEHLA